MTDETQASTPATPVAHIYKGAAKALDDSDFAKAAQIAGVSERALRAVVQVEAAGRPFDAAGRVTMLYEPHIAYRLSDGDMRQQLIADGLAYAVWGTKPYPKTSDLRFAQFDGCADIAGPEFAAQCCSWGLPQIMGFNYESAGYTNAVEMVTAFASDAERQLDAMATFIKTNMACALALSRLDWAGFAEHYNGAGYRKNAYDVKLAQAYNALGS